VVVCFSDETLQRSSAEADRITPVLRSRFPPFLGGLQSALTVDSPKGSFAFRVSLSSNFPLDAEDFPFEKFSLQIRGASPLLLGNKSSASLRESSSF